LLLDARRRVVYNQTSAHTYQLMKQRAQERQSNEKKIGTQLVLEGHAIPAPDYELHDTEIESTIDELLDRAVEVGERVSQANIARGQGPAPYAHRACTAYHAIEAIRFLQQKLEDLQDRYDNAIIELNGEDS
jgi:hypothetical protein